MCKVNDIQGNDYVVLSVDGMQYHVTANTLKWALESYLGAHLAWETDPPPRPDRQSYRTPNFLVGRVIP